MQYCVTRTTVPTPAALFITIAGTLCSPQSQNLAISLRTPFNTNPMDAEMQKSFSLSKNPMDAEVLKSFPSDNRWWSEETVAVVTGANKGIGLALVKRLVELGLTVVLTSRDVGRGLAAVEQLRSWGLFRVEFRQLDVAEEASIEAFASWLRRKFGFLDILVNNAGVTFNTVGGENTVEHAETVMRTNFYGAKRLTEALLPLFRRSPAQSRVLNVSSQLGLLSRVRDRGLREALQDEERLSEEAVERMVGSFLGHVKEGTWRDRGWPSVWTDYSVSKLALNAHSKLLARRHAGKGIAVNCFCPGFTRTAMTGGRGHHTAEEAAEVAARLVLLPAAQLPTGKFFKWGTSAVHSAL